jgi:hypothetical protein
MKICQPSIFWLLALLFALLGCDSANDDQRAYELSSFAEPEGITRTDVSGRILSLDESDWVIGPVFQGLVDVFIPVFPNPVGNQAVRIDLNVNSIDAINGLRVVTMDENGISRTLVTYPQAPLPTGIVSIAFLARTLDNTGIFTNARGLHRVWLYDRNGRLITYGDILVE